MSSKLSADDKEILDTASRIIQKTLKGLDYKLFLFGSKATGTGRYNSDYDIGIIAEKKIPRKNYVNIKTQLDELPALIDFVDFQRVEKDFQKIAMESTIPLPLSK